MHGKQEQFYRENFSRHASALAKLLTERYQYVKQKTLASKRKVSPQLQNMQDKLSRLIGEKVVINQNAKTKKGFIKINFSKETVSRVLDKLKSIKSD